MNPNLILMLNFELLIKTVNPNIMTAIFLRLLIPFLILGLVSCDLSESEQKTDARHPDAFSFAFMTDIHLNFGREESFKGFEQAIERARDMGADFIITGGDNVDADVVGEDIELARKMFSKFREIIDASETEIKVTIGNHDRFWYQPESAATHGTALYLDYFPETYYTYSFNNVHFIHLNTSEVCDGNYCVSENQRDWITQTLSNINTSEPIVLVVHVPFLSFYYPALYGYFTHTDIFDDFKEVWDMFKGHNLQLVLQGHMHLYEELNVLNTQFITGGALSAGWWHGPYHGTMEGFVWIDWDGESFNWEYRDFGWDASLF